MSTGRFHLGATAFAPRQLRYVGAALAYLLAVLYLFNPSLGTRGLVVYLAAESPLADPRPAALVLSGIALVLGVKLVLFGAPRRPIYLAGAALLLAHLLGFVAWHATGHGGFLPWREPHVHDQSVVVIVADHLADDWWALSSKAVEVALLAVLAALLVVDRQRSKDDENR